MKFKEYITEGKKNPLGIPKSKWVKIYKDFRSGKINEIPELRDAIQHEGLYQKIKNDIMTQYDDVDHLLRAMNNLSGLLGGLVGKKLKRDK